MELSESDKIILEEIQQDFPMKSNPFKIIGKQSGLSEEQVLQRVRYFVSNNIIREIAALFNSKQMGYKSILVALKVKEIQIDSLAERINLHPGVSHNYVRNNKYNIWFTLTIKKRQDFKEEVEKLLSKDNDIKYLILPSVKTFKIRVNFKLSAKKTRSLQTATYENMSSYKFKEIDKKIISKLQQDFKLIPQPWKEIADSLFLSEYELFNAIDNLKKHGVIKRISGVLRHRKVGYNFNSMICFNIPARNVLGTGKKIAEFHEVSHCYQRQTHPEWKYSIFAMVHAGTEKECEEIAKKRELRSIFP